MVSISITGPAKEAAAALLIVADALGQDGWHLEAAEPPEAVMAAMSALEVRHDIEVYI